jgi:hypothetical protein
MRPQQQNRRMRGRNNSGGGGGGNNNSNRKGPNPLTRNYESNGPDVKIRGSAQQIAEKYAQLARDAQGAGDRVMAENYLQHAEHYNRIIAAAQAQMPIQNMQSRDMSDDDMDDERDDFDNIGSQGSGSGDQPQSKGSGNEQPSRQQMNLDAAPQPVIDGTPAEVALNPDAAGDGNARRHERNQNGTNVGDNDGGRRNRRPRRGERHRPDRPFEAGEGERQAEAGSDDGRDETAQRAEPAPENVAVEPAAAEVSNPDTTLTPVES